VKTQRKYIRLDIIETIFGTDLGALDVDFRSPLSI